MKKMVIGFFAFFGFTALAFAGKPLIAEAPINGANTATTVSVSTSAWTLAPTTTLSGRVGVIVNNPSSNSAVMVGTLVESGGTIPATTVRPLEFAPGTGFTFVPVSDQVYLYLLSLHTAAENVHVQEVKQ